jgi:hypothetical protein
LFLFCGFCVVFFFGILREDKEQEGDFALEMDGENKLSIGWTDLEGTEGTHEMGGTDRIGGNA